jgi:hypothetical protein
MPSTRPVVWAWCALFAASLAVAQTPSPWVGRAAEMEAHLRTAQAVDIEDIGTGVTRPRRATLNPATPFATLVWKVLPPSRRNGFWESYKSEIAAYELDKLLDMQMVPPAVERQIDGETGAAIMWIDGTRSVKQMGGKIPTGPQFGKPIRMMQLFDNFIGNPDRNAGNILIDQANHVILIDHSRAFIESPKLPFPFERVDAPLWTKLQALTHDQLVAALSHWIDDNAIEAMLRRRDEIKSTVDKLVQRRGAAAVLIP